MLIKFIIVKKHSQLLLYGNDKILSQLDIETNVMINRNVYIEKISEKFLFILLFLLVLFLFSMQQMSHKGDFGVFVNI